MGVTELKIGIDEVHLLIANYRVLGLEIRIKVKGMQQHNIEHTTNQSHNVYMSYTIRSSDMKIRLFF